MQSFGDFYNEDSVISPSALYQKKNPDENIIAAAIYDMVTQNVYTGDSHEDAYKAMIKEEKFNMDPDRFFSTHLMDAFKKRFIEGFYTDKNNFLDRQEALEFMRGKGRPIDRKDLVQNQPHSFVVQDYLNA
jgi:hypothetical protein